MKLRVALNALHASQKEQQAQAQQLGAALAAECVQRQQLEGTLAALAAQVDRLQSGPARAAREEPA